MNRIAALLLLCSLVLAAAGCLSETNTTASAANQFKSFRSVPGITAGEIAQIEALQEKYESFSYGMVISNEAFIKSDGTIGGYAALFCDWLTEFFGIPFIPEHAAWNGLQEELRNGNLDFTGDLTPSDERRQTYFMTDAIAHRWLCHFRLEEAEPLAEIALERPLRYILFEESTIAGDVLRYATDAYEVIYAAEFEQTYDILKSGRADTIIAENTAEMYFSVYGDIVMENFLPLLDSPVSFTTHNPEFEPIISVVQKVLDNGGFRYFGDLYDQGYNEYKKHKLLMRLTEDEIEYLEANPVIPYVTEYDNYPSSFYNARSSEWQGASLDVLKEVEALSGLEFALVNDEHAEWHELLEMLETGQALFVTELLWSEEREGRFLWPETAISFNRPTLISMADYDNIDISKVPTIKVGVQRATAYTELFRSWFPNHRNVVTYESQSENYNALLNGEVDMIMSSYNNMLYMTNFLERADVKPNIIFDYINESTFGFHKDAALLCSIFDKALGLIDTGIISDQWTQRTYDYRAKVAEERLPWLIGAIALSLLVLILAMGIFYINRRRLVELSVEEKNKLANLENILNEISAMICVTDPGTNTFLFINSKMREVFGVGDNYIGQKCHKLMLDLDEKCEYCPCDQLNLEPDKEVVWERIHHQINRVYLCYSRYIKWPTGQTVHIQTSLDITTHKAAEREIAEKTQQLESALHKAEAANDAKSAFLANVSHEIRTPMNAIIGMSELALRDTEPDAKNRDIQTVRQAASNLLAIINDILDFSKIEAGKLEIVPGYYSAASLLDDVVSIIRTKAVKSRKRFTVKVDSKIPSMLYGDETRIRQAVLNILDNAFKYTKEGFVSLGVFGEFADEKTVNIIFEVKDSGIGIKPEDLDKLFSDFTKFDLEKNQGIEGTGLGLAITHRVVEKMGGNITVQSEYEKGSTFTITIPQKYDSREPLAKIDRAEERKALILIFERRNENVESIIYTLRNLGVDCTLVASEAELHEKMGNQSYSYLFIPLALYRKNKDAMQSFGSNVEIVVLTEFGEAVHESGVDVLTMPVYCVHIADVLNEISNSLSSAADHDSGSTVFTAQAARVLLVDDIYTNLKVAEGLLAPYGMRIDLCNGGSESVKAVCDAVESGERYDLIFMDHKMPGVDGIEAVRRIRALGEDDSYYKEVPIIALTANAVSGMMEMFMESGFNDFLSKPIDTARLNAILGKWIPAEKQEKL